TTVAATGAAGAGAAGAARWREGATAAAGGGFGLATAEGGIPGFTMTGCVGGADAWACGTGAVGTGEGAAAGAGGRRWRASLAVAGFAGSALATDSRARGSV